MKELSKTVEKVITSILESYRIGHKSHLQTSIRPQKIFFYCPIDFEERKRERRDVIDRIQEELRMSLLFSLLALGYRETRLGERRILINKYSRISFSAYVSGSVCAVTVTEVTVEEALIALSTSFETQRRLIMEGA